MRIAYALTIGALLVGSAASLALQSPADAQTSANDPAPSQPPQNAPARVPSVGPNGAPVSFADLTQQLQPAVVNISTKQRIEVGRMQRGNPQSLEDLFRQFQGPGQGQQGDGGEPVTRNATSLGSGFIIDPSGYVVTNNHVIAGRNGAEAVDEITVILTDRREYTARVVGRDQLSDLALLKIEARGLPYVRFGDSRQVRVGDWALAIGNPFGLGGTVTAGIVSAKQRNIGAGQYDRYIQTDASINQGNSGGPLFDLQGNVIGINTIIFSPTGGNIGLGFAIPAESARPVVQQLRDGGRVRRGYLGVAIQPLDEDIADSLGLPKNRGEILNSVSPGGPAERAGLRQGDVIVRVAGQEVTEDNTLSFTVANQRIGSSVPVEFIRSGRRQTATVVIAERPSEQQLAGPGPDDAQDPVTPPNAPGAEAARQSPGITLQALTAEVRQQLRVPSDVQGVVIAGLNPNSDAAQKGLRRGDVIRSINSVPVTTPQAAAAGVDAARRAGRGTVLLLVQSGTGPARFVGVELVRSGTGTGR